jgi:excisionase family DNA binding protein
MADRNAAARREPPGPAPQLLTPREVAKALKCSEWWVKEQARRRRIPFTWIGGSYRFTVEHLEEIVRVFEHHPTPAPGQEAPAERHTRRSRSTGPLRVLSAAAPASHRLKARPPRRASSSPPAAAED